MDKRLWVVGVVAVVIILLAVVTPNGPANVAPGNHRLHGDARTAKRRGIDTS
jgi:hypothetical protein